MARSLLLTLVLAVGCLGAAAGGFLTGRANGPDLTIVARAGTSAGARSGDHAGSVSGRRAGYRAGFQVGYRTAYAHAYRGAYLRALGR